MWLPWWPLKELDGHYVTADIDQAYLDHLDGKRNDMAKFQQETLDLSDENEDETIIGLHNSN